MQLMGAFLASNGDFFMVRQGTRRVVGLHLELCCVCAWGVCMWGVLCLQGALIWLS